MTDSTVSAPREPPTTEPAAVRAKPHSHKIRRKPEDSRRNLLEWGVVLVGALVIAALIRAFLFQAFYIPSLSMSPTLLKNDRVVVNKLSYKVHDVNRGDIVVFSRPPSVPEADKDLIKRVVGLPGETVSLNAGKVYVNGKALVEPYIAPGSFSVALHFPGCTVNLDAPLTVPAKTVFVMGDNRNASLDGRCFGPIPENHIVGRAFILLWPPGRLGWL